MHSVQPERTHYEGSTIPVLEVPPPRPTRRALSSKYRHHHLDLRKAKRDIPGDVIDAFHSASWIWVTGDPVFAPPSGLTAERAFRFSFPSPAGKVAVTAMILMTVDNQYELFVNGISVGSGKLLQTVEIYGVTLLPTLNVFAVRGLNEIENPGVRNPAGLIAAIQIMFSDGTTSLLQTDSTWRSFQGVPDKFEALDFDDSKWENATALVKYGGLPWGTNIVFRTDTMFQIISLPSATLVGPASSTSDSSLASRTSSESTRTPVGGIVGGVIGGVLFLIIFVVVLLWRSRERRRKKNRRRNNETMARSLRARSRITGSTRPPSYEDIVNVT